MLTTTSLDPVENPVDAIGVLLGVGVGVVAGLVLSYVITGVVRGIARRNMVAGFVTRRGRRPFQAILVVIGAWVGLVISTPLAPGIREATWRSVSQHVLLLLLIAAGAWFVAQMIKVVEDVALERIRTTGDTSGRSRRVQTQAQVLRRVGVALVVVLAIAAMLLTFEGARAAGASILASAGLLSVLVGLAAQTTLGSVFAGLQLAFTDAIRVDDVVIVEGEFGYIEEITLTYVVVRLWDDRRMIMPSTYFTTTPFENWTRQAPALLGTVEIDTDWRVPVPAMRAELERLLRVTDLWDGRVGVLQVFDATNGVIRMRALVSGKDVPTLTDLKYYVREHLVDWVQTQAPYAVPRQRYLPEQLVEVRDTRDEDLRGELVEELRELAGLDEGDLEDTLTQVRRLKEDPEELRERAAEARRARKRAERADRRSARQRGGLPGRSEPRPQPSADATQVMDLRDIEAARTASEPTTAGHEASVFSGSPEAEERAHAFSGPSAEELAEREEATQRRREEERRAAAGVEASDGAAADADD